MTEESRGAVSINNYPQEVDFSSLESIHTWYRIQGPDASMGSIPVETQLSAIASSTLLLLGQTPPETVLEQMTAALKFTTDTARLERQVALAEPKHSMQLIDMVVELSEQPTDLPPKMVSQLLATSSVIAAEVRDNPMNDINDRVSANARFANARLAQLRLSPNASSDDYIRVVRQEAAWMAKNAKSANSGSVFENLVSVLAQHQVWVAEAEDRVIARHATMREDMPAPKSQGGPGSSPFAHDTVISSVLGKEMIQSKWGSGADEARSEYDESVEFVAEANDAGDMYNSHMLAVFEAISTSDRLASSDVVGDMVSRYKIDRLVNRAAGVVPRALGQTAIV